MADSHKNFAYSTVATAPSPATSGTSLVVASGDGAKFPAVPFNATVWPSGSQPSTTNAEIVRVTAISTDTLTITRTQESTSARSIGVGDQIAATITAKTLTDVEAVKAWVNFDGGTADNLACTYSRTGNTVTVTSPAHGHISGHVIFADFTSGGALDGVYTITVTDVDHYTLTTAASGTIAAGSTMNENRRLIRSSSGVHDIAFAAAGTYYVNFTIAFADANYCCPGGVFWVVGNRGGGWVGVDQARSGVAAESCKVLAMAAGESVSTAVATNSDWCCLTFIR